MGQLQGYAVGFLTAFCYNVSIVVGKFQRGGGSPQKLPLSTAGCPENVLHFANTSTAAILNTTMMSEDLLHTSAFLEDLHHNTTLQDGFLPEVEEKSLYDISYCFFGISGIIITMVVSSFVSLCTGPLLPGEVDAQLVNQTSAKMYAWVWNIFFVSKKKPRNLDDKETTFTMLPKKGEV